MDSHTGTERIEASIRGEFSLCEADNNGTGRLEASSQRELSLCEAENDGPGRVEATGGGELILCEADNVDTGRIEPSGAVELVLCEVDNDGIRRKETSGGGELSSCEADRNQEPCEGMLFESEETARAFYDEYAIRVGFVTRVLSSRKSERDGSIISRGLGCRGGSDNHGVDSVASHKRDGRREGCTAMILVKRERPGRWVVRKFVRDHTHPLVVSLPLHKRRQTFDEKDKKIQELTAELRVKKRLSAAYREQLLTLMKDVEDHNEHLSTKVQVVHKNLKKLEAKRQELLHQK